MDPKELRIGNIVYSKKHDGELYQTSIDSIDEKGVNFYVPDSFGFTTDEFIYGEVSPIPITDEWLIKFGFKKDLSKSGSSIGYILCINNFELIHELYGTIRAFILQGDGGDASPGELDLPHILYVHQLQNLYFALTGKELETK